eukprot:TRINITY_DN2594_c0_g1_i1.p1 TRINITY_DN2594_c0_g1~~TRINITY_DN2594_c0_g1_i1.p1  ORF type:complete len:309 (-),score=53.98 TRINITY_DN2594_c0_g1_i1:899-1825(-)
MASSTLLLALLFVVAISAANAVTPRVYVTTEADLRAAVAKTHDEVGYIFLAADIKLTSQLFITDAHQILSDQWPQGSIRTIDTSGVLGDYAIYVSLASSVTEAATFKFINIDGMGKARTFPSVTLDSGKLQFISAGITNSYDASAYALGGGIEVKGEGSGDVVVTFFPTMTKASVFYPSFLMANRAYSGGAASVYGASAYFYFCYGKTFSNARDPSLDKEFKDVVYGDGAQVFDGYGKVALVIPGVTFANFPGTPNVGKFAAGLNDTTSANFYARGNGLFHKESNSLKANPIKACSSWVKKVAKNIDF